jgi:predicted neuraminidase
MLLAVLSLAMAVSQPTPIVKREFIFDTAPFKSCHASTIAETRDGLVAAWFGGTHEGAADVGIWLSKLRDSKWTAPQEVAADRLPCWNPVLFQPRQGPLLLFYKVGHHPASWWGMLITSADGGTTWLKPRRLPNGILGPIKDKPIELSDGALLCPSSQETIGWTVHFERTSDGGANWERTPPLGPDTVDAIQPTILSNGQVLTALVRTKQGLIFSARSSDTGLSWSPLEPTSLPNPNSGIDAVTLRDGRSFLVYNDTDHGRSPLNLAVSNDAVHWKPVAILEDEPSGEFSYPAIIQTSDGLVHITYTWNRLKIAHLVIDPAMIH